MKCDFLLLGFHYLDSKMEATKICKSEAKGSDFSSAGISS